MTPEPSLRSRSWSSAHRPRLPAALAAASALLSAPPWLQAECGPWTWANPLPQGNSLTALAVGNGRVVAVGRAGTIMTSDDHGATWTLRDAGIDEPLSDVVWTGSDFVAVGRWHLVTSADGGTWTRFDPTPLFTAAGIDWKNEGIELVSVASDGRIVVVGGTSGTQLRRDASAVWRLDRVGVQPSLTLISWGAGRWVGLAQRQSGTALYSSTNGTRWTLRDNGFWMLSDLAWNGTAFLSIGIVTSGGGAVSVALTSSDGEDWSATPLPDLGPEVLLRAVAWDGARWVAVGSYGALATSSDGVDWAAGETGFDSELARVLWTGRTLVVVGEYGALITSPDALTWTDRRHGPTDWLFGITPMPTGFLAVGQGGVVASSADGTVWERSTTPITQALLGVTWTGERLIAVGREGTILASTDGVEWTRATAATEAGLLAVAWNGHLAVAVGTDGAVVTSPDGLTWTPTVPATSETLYAVTWGADRFIAVGANGAVVTSTDGLAWTALEPPTRQWLYGIAWSGAALVACGSTETVMTSTDGLSWNAVTGGLDAFQAIEWDGEQFEMVSGLGQVLTSADGLVWTRERPVTENPLRAVAEGAGITVAVGGAGTVIRRECDREPRVRRRLWQR